MIPIQEFKVIDRNSEYYGVPVSQLMENAADALAKSIRENFDLNGKTIGMVCGTGNNAGDAFAATRRLKDECRIILFLVRPSDKLKSELARKHFNDIRGIVRVVEQPSDWSEALRECDILVDALLGTGVSGEIREPYASAITAINSSGKPVVSVDVPSGLGCNLTVKPTITVTFHDSKEGMTEENSGKILVRDIGIPEEAELYTGPGEFALYPVPGAGSHKGENGRVLIVGGGPYTGAPALAALGAFGIGADLVHIATPTISYQVMASFSPNFIVHPLAGTRLLGLDAKRIHEISQMVDAVIIGPGLGQSSSVREATRAVIEVLEKPLVIDADGIKAVAEDLSCLEGKSGVITPHSREFETLSKERLPKDREARTETVKRFAERTGFTILLKGRTDYISDGKRVKMNRTGNPGMTVGGTGDVLSGIVGGLLAKGCTPFDAARMAAYANGRAGDMAYEKLSYGMTATDVAERVPWVLKEVLEG